MATTSKKLTACCVLSPLLLIGSCAGKMGYQSWRYELPGEVLASSTKPTRQLKQPMEVAEALDTYVQPRFEILRDKNFGALRIVYRQHAGIVQLKVDTELEKRLIADVNAAKCDYSVCLLHCAPKPGRFGSNNRPPQLEMLYFNRRAVASSQNMGGSPRSPSISEASQHGMDFEVVEADAIDNLPKLMLGVPAKGKVKEWTLLYRPVVARSRECLGCHTGTKPGSTLGVMVYAVRAGETGAINNVATTY